MNRLYLDQLYAKFGRVVTLIARRRGEPAP